MKKYVVYFLASLSGLWVADLVLPGVKFNDDVLIKFILAGIVTGSIILIDILLQKLGKKGYLWFILVGILINFFVLYLATFLNGFAITGGNLTQLNLPFQADQILMLLLTSLELILFATVGKWATESNA